jgi:hypothetical protein
VRLVFHDCGDQSFLAAVSDRLWESTYDFKISTEEKLVAKANPRKPVIVSVDPAGSTVVIASRNRT